MLLARDIPSVTIEDTERAAKNRKYCFENIPNVAAKKMYHQLVKFGYVLMLVSLKRIQKVKLVE